VTPYVVREMPPPVDRAVLAELSGVETATVGHWRHLGFMQRGIQPLLRGHRVTGTAVTLAIPGPDSTLLHYALGLLRPGDILVVDRLGDDRHACWGGAVTLAAKAAGAVAGIVDGPCTDLAEIEASQFPMWARGIAPVTTRLYDLGGYLNVPVSCGGAVVRPGDAVLADDSGVLVLPPGEVAAVVAEALHRQARGAERERAVSRDGAKLGDLTGASDKVRARLQQN
jgi:4-hydroxy-4-methyl-2-oxoglutarate aldolase